MNRLRRVVLLPIAFALAACSVNGELAATSRTNANRPGPSGVSGDLYVASAPNSSVKTWITVFSGKTYKRLLTIPTHDNGGTGSTSALIFDSKDDAYWADVYNRTIDIFPPGKSKPSRRITWGFAAPYA